MLVKLLPISPVQWAQPVQMRMHHAHLISSLVPSLCFRGGLRFPHIVVEVSDSVATLVRQVVLSNLGKISFALVQPLLKALHVLGAPCRGKSASHFVEAQADHVCSLDGAVHSTPAGIAPDESLGKAWHFEIEQSHEAGRIGGLQFLKRKVYDTSFFSRVK